MSNIMTIVKKEFKDILRDRKTLLMTFVIPIIIMPLLFTFIFSSVSDLASPRDCLLYTSLNHHFFDF